VRKILITQTTLALTVGAILGTRIFLGRQVSLWVDRFGTIEIASIPIHSVAYEGSGTGGWLTVNDSHLSLVESRAHIAWSIGSTKENQFSLACGGKVFAFGAAYVYCGKYRRRSCCGGGSWRSGVSGDASQRSQLADAL